FLEATGKFGSHAAFRHRPGGGRGRWEATSYDRAREVAVSVAAAFADAGLERGDRVALLSSNRPEWALTDYGALLAGVQIVPVYSTLTPEDVEYLVNDSEARAVVASDQEQLAKVLEIRDDCPSLEWAVVFDPPPDLPEGVNSWDTFLARGRDALRQTSEEEILEKAREADPDDVATMLYTSGTTGKPKGVMLTHNNIFSNVKACENVLSVGKEDATLSILPVSHILQRMVDYLFFYRGCTIAYPESIDTAAADMADIRPTVVVGVPRLFEKIYNRVMEATGFRGALIQWAREVGEAWADEDLAGRRPSLVLRMAYSLADRLVFKKIRERVGGRIRYFVSGGGPLSPEINKFFYSVGLPILEGYGLTETSPVTNVNRVDDIRIGTVGPPVPGTEIKIGENNEILVRGPQVMKGYFKLPEETEEALTEDGWFHTGDMGEIDEDGFLTITDRLKDIIVTSGGKNIAPQPIENALKKNRFIEQVVMLGDRRKFPSILVVPSFGTLRQWARDQGIRTDDDQALLENERVQEHLEKEIFGELEGLARYELPKKVGLLPEDFTVEGGALTPSQKVKRRVVEDRYRDLIDSFYEEDAVEQTMFVAKPRKEDG
ncbi:MAG: AMP-dependent synthetase/ligase, partial [Gemmatimonadota bacterium]